MKNPKFWDPLTFEISTFKYNIASRINKIYQTSGSDNSKKGIYTYNQLGFRGDSINKEGFRVMSIGCSYTEGVGVNDHETWPAQFTKLIEDGVNMNFGISGRSNDYTSRCLLTYYDIIKPDLVLIMYTFPARREFYSPEGGIEPFKPGASWGYFSDTDNGKKLQILKEETQNDFEDIQNWYKNHLLISYFLKYKNIPFIWNGCFLETDYMDEYRYDGNYNTFVDKGFDDGKHPGPKHNEVYAKNLYEHIQEKFPSFLVKKNVTERLGYKNKLI